MTAATAERLGHIRQPCGSPSAKVTHRAKGEQCRVCWPGDGLPVTTGGDQAAQR